MINALVGRKIGMTQLFDETGNLSAVTVLQVGPCQVTQLKQAETDGYYAVQIGFEDKTKNIKAPETGHFKKSGVAPKRHLREVRFAKASEAKLGDTVTCEVFQAGEKVDVIAVTKGRGFAGTIKRHGFTRGPETHGSMNVRAPGSMGSNTDPGRVWKGKRLGGHYGHERHTQRNLLVLKVDAAKHLLLVRGAVAGPNGGLVTVRKAKYKTK